MRGSSLSSEGSNVSKRFRVRIRSATVHLRFPVSGFLYLRGWGFGAGKSRLSTFKASILFVDLTFEELEFCWESCDCWCCCEGWFFRCCGVGDVVVDELVVFSVAKNRWEKGRKKRENDTFRSFFNFLSVSVFFWKLPKLRGGEYDKRKTDLRV